MTIDRDDGLSKLVIDNEDERILGVGLVGPGAGELIAEGVLAMEMETNALYTIAARHKVKALSILTVSDNLCNNDHASSEQRQTAVEQMVLTALDVMCG